jgi:hypothetical protein
MIGPAYTARISDTHHQEFDGDLTIWMVVRYHSS